MSDFGLFDSIETNENEQRIATRESTQVIDRAIHAVSEKFGRMLSSSTSLEDFNDRVALVNNDMMKIVAEHLMPKPAVMRRVKASQKPNFSKRASNPADEDTPENLKAWEQDYEDDQDGTRQLHERGPLANRKPLTAGWLLDDVMNLLSTPLGNGWETFIDGGGKQVLYHEYSDYDGGSVTVPTDGSSNWSWVVWTRLYQHKAGEGVESTPEAAMAAADNAYLMHKSASKTADTAVDPQHLPDHFDDEGSVTDLDDAGRDTAPRDASRKTAGYGDWTVSNDRAHMTVGGSGQTFAFDVYYSDGNYGWISKISWGDDQRIVSELGSCVSVEEAIDRAEPRILNELSDLPFNPFKHSARDSSTKRADQDKAKKLVPSKDWAGYLRDRAAGGKKVRDNNFTKGSMRVQAAKDFPELSRKVAGLSDWDFSESGRATFFSDEVNADVRYDGSYDGTFLLEMFFFEPDDDYPTGTKITRIPGASLEEAARNAEAVVTGEAGHDPFMYSASKKTAAQLEWYGEGNDYQTFFEDDNPPPGPQGYVGVDMNGVWYGYIYDAYANENIWDGSGFNSAHDAINAVDGKLLTLGTYVARVASDFDENLLSARVIQRKLEAQEDPSEVNPEPSGSDAYGRSEDMETLDPDKVETQPKDASRKQAWSGFGGGLGGGYEFDVMDGTDGAEGFRVWRWSISKGFREEDIVMSGVIEQSTMDRYELRDFIDQQFVTYMRTAKRKKTSASAAVSHYRDFCSDEGLDTGSTSSMSRYFSENDLTEAEQDEVRDFMDNGDGGPAVGSNPNYYGNRRRADTKVDPQHLPDHFDDEGGSTDLDDAGRPTQPKDAALAKKWHSAKAKGMSLPDFAAFHDLTASTAKRVARLPFADGHLTVADAQDTYATSPLVDDVEDLDHHVPVIEHFSRRKEASPNYMDGVDVTPDEWDTWGEDQLFGPDSTYDSWVTDYHGGAHSTDALEDYISNGVGGYPSEGLDAIRRHWSDRYSSRAARRVNAGFQDANWRQYPSGGDWTEIDGTELEIYADYEDGLYPEGNPRALWCGRAGDDEPDAVYIFNGQGELVDTKPAYDYGTAASEANKVLQKLYKGEAMVPKGQGKFFTKPGQGKLFGSRTAASIGPADVQHLGEGWYMYEPAGGAQLTVTERTPDNWEIEVDFPDGRSEETTVNSWNDVDAVQSGVDFYNRVARRTATRTASSPIPRAASGGIHRVAGWDWDQRQSAYIAQSGQDSFDCTCGQKVATPSFKTCECGTIWNSYHIETSAGRKTLCREVPSRDALLASL